jgi:hypothetical protein
MSPATNIHTLVCGDWKTDDGFWYGPCRRYALPACPDCGDPLSLTLVTCFEATGSADPSLDAEQPSVECSCGSSFTTRAGHFGAIWLRRRRYPQAAEPACTLTPARVTCALVWTAEREADEDAERKAREDEDDEWKADEDAEREADEDAERKAREDEDDEWKADEDAERRVDDRIERKAREDEDDERKANTKETP